MKPLTGVTVVDVSEGAQGPVAASLLGDLGADVWKIERPGGEFMRRVGPFRDGEALPILHTAHGRSTCIEVDLKAESGRATVRRLAQRADVFLENWRPGTADRLGLGVGDMAEAGLHDLVYVSGTGYGLTGPLASLGSLDQLGQAASGMWQLSGQAGGEGERFRGALLDFVSGFVACEAVLLGLIRRGDDRGPGPIHMEVSQLAAGLALVEPELLLEQLTGGIAPQGDASRFFAPSGTYLAADGRWLALDITTPDQWHRLTDALGIPSLARPEFQTNARRVEHRADLDAVLDGLFADAPADHWIELLDGLPITAVARRLDETMTDDHVFGRTSLHATRHRDGRDLVRPLTPWTFDGGDAVPGPPAPPAGRDNDRLDDLLTR